MMRPMDASDLSGLDAPACPLLGLAADRRSHFSYPHPGHRCFAKHHPTTTDPVRQSSYCLSPRYPTCDRFRAWQLVNGQATQVASQPAPTVIHVARTGETVASVAALYGLTSKDLAAANHIAEDAALVEGTRLVLASESPSKTARGRVRGSGERA
jgi:hypothetical protein